MSIKIPNLLTAYERAPILQPIVLEELSGKKLDVFILPFPMAPDAVLHEGRIFKHVLAGAYRESVSVNTFETEAQAEEFVPGIAALNETLASSFSPNSHRHLQRFVLETRTGDRVSEVWGLATQQAAEIVTWGIRCFKHEIANVYRECFAVMAFEDEAAALARLSQEVSGETK